MAMLAINLISPADGTRLIGNGIVTLTAALAAPAPVPLFYKWYSSLAADPLGTALDVPVVALPLGSQVLTLAVKDQALDTPDAIKAVLYAGMAGGPTCVVHVLIAELHEPAAGATLNRAGAKLSARAPSVWARKIPPATAYEINPDYQKQNKLVYRWTFVPSGLPSGRASKTFSPTPDQWSYVAPKADDGTNPTVPLLRHDGALPAGLDTGSYTLTLRVEDADDATRSHEQSIAVTLS